MPWRTMGVRRGRASSRAPRGCRTAQAGRGPAGPPTGLALPASPRRGRQGRGGGRGEPSRIPGTRDRGTQSKRATARAQQKRPRGRSCPGPKPRRGPPWGAPAGSAKDLARPRPEQGQPEQREGSPQRRKGKGRGLRCGASGCGAAQRRTKPERKSRGAGRRPGSGCEADGTAIAGSGRAPPERLRAGAGAPAQMQTRSGAKRAGKRARAQRDRDPRPGAHFLRSLGGAASSGEHQTAGTGGARALARVVPGPGPGPCGRSRTATLHSGGGKTWALPGTNKPTAPHRRDRRARGADWHRKSHIGLVGGQARRSRAKRARGRRPLSGAAGLSRGRRPSYLAVMVRRPST